MNQNKKKEMIYMPKITLVLNHLEILNFFTQYVHKRDDNSFFFNGQVVRGREEPISIELDLEQAQDENIFSYIWFGDDCPNDRDLYSIICEWNRQYGVKLSGISSHSIAFQCSRDLTEQQIEELASRIIHFCPSSVELQSQRSQKALERKIKGEHRFSLWWD